MEIDNQRIWPVPNWFNNSQDFNRYLRVHSQRTCEEIDYASIYMQIATTIWIYEYGQETMYFVQYV